jgi:hypothetical protein
MRVCITYSGEDDGISGIYSTYEKAFGEAERVVARRAIWKSWGDPESPEDLIEAYEVDEGPVSEEAPEQPPA